MLRKGIIMGRWWLAMLLCIVIVASSNFGLVAAAEEDDTGLCEHHPVHTAECGYVAAIEGQPCRHIHDEVCGYRESVPETTCDRNCTDTDGDGIVNHVEDCAFTPAAEAQPCNHVHDDTCGYVQSVVGSPCTYECLLCSAAQGDSKIGETLDGDFAYISAAYLVSDKTTDSGYAIRTGSAPFDADDNAGNDFGDLNNTVRNSDTVSYTVAFESKVRENASDANTNLKYSEPVKVFHSGECTPVTDEAVAATCTKTGLTEGSHCSICGKTIVAQQEVAMQEHEIVIDAAVEPTYTSTGLTEGQHCKNCDTQTIKQETIPMLEKPAGTQSAPLYRVTDKDGKGISYKAEQKDGVLTITVDADFAILTGKLNGIDILKSWGVEKIVFATKNATSTFALANLLEKGSTGETYKLTHDGKTVTFTLGVKNTGVSDILEKA